jgi:peptide deformylase
MLKLVSQKDEILAKSMPDFDFDNPIIDPYKLEEQLVLTMAEENGIGLAAPQVGIETRVFAIYCRNLPNVTTPFAVFNPSIVAVSEEEESGEEGCLSFPGLFFHVKRPSKILVEFFDRNKNKLTITLEGIDARCFQHELDHLNGVCFTSKVSKFKLDRAIAKQRKNNGRTK